MLLYLLKILLGILGIIIEEKKLQFTFLEKYYLKTVNL